MSVKKMALSATILASALMAGSGPVLAQDDLNDLEVAHIAYTAGTIDIRYAHLALAISDNPEVLEFARLMLQDHVAVNQAAGALLGELNATPQDNSTSQTLLAQAAEQRALMSGMTGSDFDMAYAANELAYHQFVNNAVENLLIPTTEIAELRDLLGVALETFKVHEGHAEMMVEGLR